MLSCAGKRSCGMRWLDRAGPTHSQSLQRQNSPRSKASTICQIHTSSRKTTKTKWTRTAHCQTSLTTAITLLWSISRTTGISHRRAYGPELAPAIVQGPQPLVMGAWHHPDYLRAAWQACQSRHNCNPPCRQVIASATRISRLSRNRPCLHALVHHRASSRRHDPVTIRKVDTRTTTYLIGQVRENK